MKKSIPSGYEEVFGDTIIQMGDKFLTHANVWGICSSSIGKTVARKGRRVIRKITRQLTPEEKENQLKKQAKDFVDKHITNPTEKIYQKYELAFLKDDNTGL